ncbi:hypothetical protein [Microbacterium sp. Se5.02b]|uniref:hypothetical protein n=1 Tax=Microbacterium sp. Se5.02b TaxID=2864103 RepID=UPI001C688A0E|nr:hypothetical protein [Microbacterium sp. Se5.02b]QYM64303.1 hypothetical protein K1X59_20075 [Microbacterium sp. Se5.02b]
MNGRYGVTQLFEELEVERGASVQSITARVSVLLGVDIEVDVLDDDEWKTVPRFVLVDGDRARIALRGSDPRWYRLHVVAHELAHLLCGHSQCAALPMSFDDPGSPSRRARSPSRSCVSKRTRPTRSRVGCARSSAHRASLPRTPSPVEPSSIEPRRLIAPPRSGARRMPRGGATGHPCFSAGVV